MLLKIEAFLFHSYFTISVIMIVICFLKNWLIKKVKIDIIPKTNEELISVTYGCIRFFDSYRFLSSGLYSLVKTLVDNSHKTMKNLKEEIVDNDEILNNINKIVEEDKTIEDLKKDYPNEIKSLEEAILDYVGENDLKILKTGFPDKWKFLNKKLVYLSEFFNCIEDYQKPIDTLKKEDLFNKLKIKCPGDEEIQRTVVIFNKFNIDNGGELTEINSKSDVLLFTCVFENFIKESFNEFENNPLYCVSLPGYTWQCGLKYTNINLQTLQDNNMVLLLENNMRGGISSVMRDRYVISDENKKLL